MITQGFDKKQFSKCTDSFLCKVHRSNKLDQLFCFHIEAPFFLWGTKFQKWNKISRGDKVSGMGKISLVGENFRKGTIFLVTKC